MEYYTFYTALAVRWRKVSHAFHFQTFYSLLWWQVNFEERLFGSDNTYCLFLQADGALWTLHNLDLKHKLRSNSG